MPVNRSDALRQILEQNPTDTLARYGLAMEHIKAGDFEAAVSELKTLIDAQPDYLYAYFHAAQTLEKLSRIEDAKKMYGRGIQAAIRKGDGHARDELQAALAEIK